MKHIREADTQKIIVAVEELRDVVKRESGAKKTHQKETNSILIKLSLGRCSPGERNRVGFRDSLFHLK